MAITLYPPNCDDFSTNGLGVLTPVRCTVSEESCGRFELELEQPIDGTLRWAQLETGCILKAPVPTRESPLYEEVEDIWDKAPVTVTRNVWEVTGTSTGLYMRSGPGMNHSRYGYLRNGARVNEIGRQTVSGRLWVHVIVQKGGRNCWMSTRYLKRVGTVTETVVQGTIVGQRSVAYEQSREQLFRIYSVERDAREAIVTAKAMHISYDLRANLVNSAYEVKKPTEAKAVLRSVFDKLAVPTDFSLHVAAGLGGTVKGDYSWKNPIECMLDPDDGILPQAKALLVRDNFDLFVLPDATRDSGVTIRRGKNLKGVTVTRDAGDVVTRIIPCGKTRDGKDLFLDGANYIDSPRIGDYPFPCVRKIDYDVRVVEKDADNEESFSTVARAREKLRQLARADFAENGADLPTYGLEVDFVLLQNTAECADYASLQAVFLNDTVTVIDSLIGLTAKLRVTGCEWNALTCQYEKLTLGDIGRLEQTVYSYNLPDGGISGSKIAAGSLPGAALRDATIEYAKIGAAAIEQLTAQTVTAVQGRIQELITEQITTEGIQAGVVEAMVAWLRTVTAESITTDELAAQFARLQVLIAGTATFDKATIQHLVAEALHLTFGELGRVYIDNLMVNYAQMVSAAIGDLVVKASDGSYYHLDVAPDGTVSATQVSVTEGEINAGQTSDGHVILETDITADNLSTSNLLATFALINRIDAARIDVDQLFAREAFLTLLRTSRIVGDKSLEIIVEDAADADARIDGVAKRVDDCVTHPELATYMRTVAPGENPATPPGVYVGLMENGRRPTAEAFIDATGWFRVLNNGVSITSLGPRIQELGTLTIYETADGGHAFI